LNYYNNSMTNKKDKYPKVTRPGEYVAFFTMQAKTKEGPAYIFLGCDAFSEFAFNTGVEPDKKPESILKHIYLLTENPDFVRHMHKGFTLVLDEHLELAEKITAILKTVNGKLMYDKDFHEKIARPVVKSFSQMLFR